MGEIQADKDSLWQNSENSKSSYNTVQIGVNLPFPNSKQIKTVSLWQNSENSKSSYNTVQIGVNLPFPNYKQVRTVSLWQNSENSKSSFSCVHLTNMVSVDSSVVRVPDL